MTTIAFGHPKNVISGFESFNPANISIDNRSFLLKINYSPSAQLHCQVLATEGRLRSLLIGELQWF